MKKVLLFFIAISLPLASLLAQNSVGIGTENPSANAVLQLVSPTNNQGFLVPRLNTAQRTADAFTSRLTVSDNGLMVFDTNLSTFFYWIGNRWELVSGQLLTGGAGVTIDENGVISVQPDVPQDLVLANNQLRITNNTAATVIDLTPYLNIQNASQVVVTPTATLTSGTVQAALEELQAEILNPPGNMLKATYDPTNINGSAFDLATHTGTLPSTRITGLGTAATLNAGTGSNNLVQLDAIGLPAVDGSRLTGLVLPQFPALGALSLLDVVGSTEITDNSIFNADINIAAQIAGTKITPNFGAQNISTTGNISTGPATLNGTLKLVDGTQGLGKILISDAAGLASWQSATGTSWGITGNAGMVDGTNFIGTIDSQPLSFKVNNIAAGKIDPNGNLFLGLNAGAIATGGSNTFIGNNAGNSTGIGNNNTFVGANAGVNNTDGAHNSFYGTLSGNINTTGVANTFLGYGTGQNNTTAGFNTFVGEKSGNKNTTGIYNSFFGAEAGFNNLSANSNSFFGYQSGFENTTGANNVFVGNSSGLNNLTGFANSFFGSSSGMENTTGTQNSFFGRDAGRSNTTSSNNSFFGTSAGRLNTTGDQNSFFGGNAGVANTTGNDNAFFGFGAGSANIIGSKNTIIGRGANVASDGLTNASAIGFNAIVSASNSLVLGGTGGDAVNVGIGTTTPASTFSVGGTSQFRINATGNLTRVNNVPYSWPTGNSAGFLSNNGSGTLSWQSALNAANNGLTLNGSTVSLGGSLTAPTTITMGTRNLTFDSNSGGVITFNLGNVNSDFFIKDQGGNFLFTVDGISGKVGIGTADPNPLVKLDIFGAGPGIQHTDGNLSIQSQIAGNDAWFGTSSANHHFHILAGGFDRAIMRGDNGRFGIGRNPTANSFEVEGNASKTTATAWLANSDKRIKTDIRDIENSLQLIKSLRPVKFKYTDEWMAAHPSIKNHYYYNFIAQEYQEVFPESVQSSGEYLAGDSSNAILQIDTYNAQIASIKAVQELIYKIEALEKENEALKSTNSALESKLTSVESNQSAILKDLASLKALLTGDKSATNKTSTGTISTRP